MIGSRTIDKTILSILSMVTGILLFLSSFAFMLNSVFFDSGFQKEAISKLGIGGYVSNIANEMSSGAAFFENQATPVFSDIVTPDLINRNVQSLIDGLVQYFKGNTNTLPDILLPDLTGLTGLSDITDLPDITDLMDRSNVAADFDINEGYPDSMGQQNTTSDAFSETMKSESLQNFGCPEKINLRGVLMIFSEPRIADIMLVINLFQFILSQIPYLCLFLIILLCTMMFHKSTAPYEIRIHIQSAAAVYSILCVSSGFLIQLFLYLKPSFYLYLTNIPEFISSRVLTGYIDYFANSLSTKLVLSGIILFGGVHAVILFLNNSNQKAFSYSSDFFCHFKPEFQHATSSSAKYTGFPAQKTAVTTLLVITLLATGFYLHVHVALQNFSDRNLSRAVAFLKGNDPYYQVIDARNDQVYLLHVKVSDKMTGQPVEGLTIHVSNRDNNNYEYVEYITDSEGSAVFSLVQASFMLKLHPIGPLSAYNLPEWLSYEFEMTKPGMEELQIVLDMQSDGLAYIQETFMQYIP